MSSVSDWKGGVRSEVVLGFVGPVGVEGAQFHETATNRLKEFGYEPALIRLSEYLNALKEEGLLRTELAATPEYERVVSHMDAGDELRGLAVEGARGLLAAAAVAMIASARSRNAQGQTTPMPCHAWLISSLKNPAEVEVFRRVYGPGFFLIGLFATEAERRQFLERSMTPREANELIGRDREADERYGQQTRKTFELADAWVTDNRQLCRVLELIFGNSFETPTDDEDGMALAYAAAMRSSDLSRQVGAALVSKTGEVIGTGRNEAPAPGGGQYSPPTPTKPTARDCDLGEDYNAKERLRIQEEIAAELDAVVQDELGGIGAMLDGEQRAKFEEKLDNLRRLVRETLPETSLRDITEYGRAVHAEMSVLMSAARIGVSVKGATLYCTTFPCHNCAKHIAAAGIARVVFVEPYPKSKATYLHADAIELVGEQSDGQHLSARTDTLKEYRTRFEPFVGVGPRRYFDLFSMKLGSGRMVERKDTSGTVRAFDPATASPRVPLEVTTYLEEEIIAARNLEVAKQVLQERLRT
jgi:deoxycytidylate deaminase